MPDKVCNVCHESKALDQFAKDKSRTDGYQHICKTCDKKKGADYYKNNDKRASKIAEHSRSKRGKFSSYKTSAKQRGKEWKLTFDEFVTFWQANCSYCKKAISTIGLDRVDNAVGYQINNVVACCSRCNTMKMSVDKETWFDEMFQILKENGVI